MPHVVAHGCQTFLKKIYLLIHLHNLLKYITLATEALQK